MQNNKPNDYFQEDEIDLKKIFELLINSKKLIIVTTLVITILGAIYSSQKETLYKSSALIEIGNYGLDEYSRLADEDWKQTKYVPELIESAETLIEELMINFHYKQQANVSFIFLKEVDRLIQIDSTSASSVNNKNLLNEIIEYIENRHSILLNENKQRITNQLTYEIESLNDQIEYINSELFIQNEDEKLRIANQIISLNKQIEYINSELFIQNEDEKLRIANQIISLNKQIEFTNSTLLTQNEDEKLRISNEIESLYNELPGLDKKIKSLNEIIISDQNNLLLLESNAELFIQRAAQAPTLDQVIFTYQTTLIDYENEKIKLSYQKDNLERQLKFLESNDLESEKVFSLSQEKDNLESQLKFLESNDLESEKVFSLSQEKDNLERQLKFLESNDLESEKVFSLSQEKNSLELELEFQMKQNPTSTQLIREIVTNTIESKKELSILLSFIFGLFLSIVMVYINNSLKALKEE
jgi:hypothetical protein